MTSKEFKKMMGDFQKGQAREESLDKILEIQEPGKLFQSLVNYRKGAPLTSRRALKQQHDIVRAVILVNALHMSVVSGGIGQFLREPETGSFFHELERFCNEIGAASAAKYLSSVAAYFPGQLVPEEDEARFETTETLAQNPACRDFQLLDEQYADSFMELAAALRTYIRRNQTRLAEILAGVTPQ